MRPPKCWRSLDENWHPETVGQVREFKMFPWTPGSMAVTRRKQEIRSPAELWVPVCVNSVWGIGEACQTPPGNMLPEPRSQTLLSRPMVRPRHVGVCQTGLLGPPQIFWARNSERDPGVCMLMVFSFYTVVRYLRTTAWKLARQQLEIAVRESQKAKHSQSGRESQEKWRGRPVRSWGNGRAVWEEGQDCPKKEGRPSVTWLSG